VRVKELRVARGWSQAHLAELTGLSVRTIQRIETGAHPGLESLRGLAAAFGVDVADLQPEAQTASRPMSFFDAVAHCMRHYSDLDGRAGRAEFWWFTLAIALALTLAAAIGSWASVAVGVVALVPWLAAAVRRLRDAGESPWWLVLLLAPVANFVVVPIVLAMPTVDGRDRQQTPTA
jgi:transcriptional regulator with XRE-family HTH domain